MGKELKNLHHIYLLNLSSLKEFLFNNIIAKQNTSIDMTRLFSHSHLVPGRYHLGVGGTTGLPSCCCARQQQMPLMLPIIVIVTPVCCCRCC